MLSGGACLCCQEGPVYADRLAGPGYGLRSLGCILSGALWRGCGTGRESAHLNRGTQCPRSAERVDRAPQVPSGRACAA